MELTDNAIILLFFNNPSKPMLLRKSYINYINNNPEIKQFLENRYTDSTSYKETLYRIKLKIESRPTCKICGKPTRFLNYLSGNSYFSKTCSKSCLYKLTMKESDKTKLYRYGLSTYNNREKATLTFIEHYGETNPMKVKTVLEKIKQTNILRYGVPYSAQNPDICQKTVNTQKLLYGNVFNPNKVKQTNLSKFGVETPFESPDIQKKCRKSIISHYGSIKNFYKEVKEKSIQTCLQKYGKHFYVETDEFKEKTRLTCIEKYNNETFFGSDFALKQQREILMEKYGVPNSMLIPETILKRKQTCLNRYGVESYVQTDMFKQYLKDINNERIQKIYNTKKKNHTFTTSKPEQEIKQLLEQTFGSYDIEYQYKSDLYPFNCDFYIKHLDLYIECNFHWTHGKHKFNENNNEDLIQLNYWKERNFTSAIKTWTIRDINKFNIAALNKLNYKAFYTIEECKQFIETLI